jgi:hypothetical protein
MKLSVEDILINPIERLLSLLVARSRTFGEMQGAGCTAVVGYRKCPATQQIR